MHDLTILFIHLLTTIAKLMRLGGGRAVVAESLLLKHQLVVLNRGRARAPNLRPMDRAIAGLCTLFIRPYGTDKLTFRLVLFSVYTWLMWLPHISKTQRRVVGKIDSVWPISNAAPD